MLLEITKEKGDDDKICATRKDILRACWVKNTCLLPMLTACIKIIRGSPSFHPACKIQFEEFVTRRHEQQANKPTADAC